MSGERKDRDERREVYRRVVEMLAADPKLSERVDWIWGASR